ncbi:BglG family transcription antiterminator [Lacrimispora sp.]|uniref:BglG family transcription antiterminator n=1 Tax=Lacrimispora sp. TaxID=2719234 RepID=UPI0028ADD742|nr:BglG family transcription antiterminator [Lacrimispora sp.]
MQVIEKRAFNLLQYLLSDRNFSVSKAMDLLGCSKRQIEYDVSKINELLKENEIELIRLSRGRFLINKETIDKVTKLNLPHQKFIVNGENKIWLICIQIFCTREPLGLNHFITKLQSSKNTVLGDLRKIARIGSQYKVELKYSRKSGYYFEGEPIKIRSLVLLSIINLKDNFLCKELISLAVSDNSYDAVFEETKDKTESLIKEFNLPIMKEYRTLVIYFISLLPYHCQSITYVSPLIHEPMWNHLPLYAAVTAFYESLTFHLSKEEIDYLFVLLLSVTLGDNMYFQLYDQESIFLQEMCQSLINRFEVITGTVVQKKAGITENMLMHLRLAYFRLKYGIPVVNPALMQVKKEYGEVFDICRFVLEPFGDYLDCLIPDDEIAYIALHFMTVMDLPDQDKIRKRAIIVCQNGLASSVMMKNQLIKVFPEIHFVATCNAEEFKRIPVETYDMVFSTTEGIDVPEEKYLFLSSPILTVEEKFIMSEAVYSSVFGIKSEANVTVHSILEVVEKYAVIHDQKGLSSDLKNLLQKKYKKESGREGGLPVIKDLLTKETIQFASRVNSWEEAIWLGARPLLENGSITKAYINAMIDNVKGYGPYIVICPYVAIPHAQNQTGVNKLGMSFLKLEEEVCVLDNPQKPVKVFITMAAIDNHTHLRALAQLSNILTNEDTREQFLACNSVEEVLQLLDIDEE